MSRRKLFLLGKNPCQNSIEKAEAFANAINLDVREKEAYKYFVKKICENGIYSTLEVGYPFIGQANAEVGKNMLMDARFNLTINGNHSIENGLEFGTNGYANTHFRGSFTNSGVGSTLKNCTTFILSKAATGNEVYLYGASQGAYNNYMVRVGDGRLDFYTGSWTDYLGYSHEGNMLGVYTHRRLNGKHELYKNSVLIAETNTEYRFQFPYSHHQFLGAVNPGDSGSYKPSNCGFQFWSQHKDLDANKIKIFHDELTELQVKLNRKNW